MLDRRERELGSLEEQRNSGKISEEEFQKECNKVEKWTKRETTEIAQARKNLWRGYNEAKGIIEKTLKSRQFQEESAKKKGMMKCLSEDYLLKANYKSLLKQQQSEESEESEEEGEASEKGQEESEGAEEVEDAKLEKSCGGRRNAANAS